MCSQSAFTKTPAVGHLLALGAVLAYFVWRVVGNSKEARYRSQREELLRRASVARSSGVLSDMSAVPPLNLLSLVWSSHPLPLPLFRFKK